MSYLTLKNINKYYGRVHVLKDVSLKIEKGAFVSFLGPSGSGKTTLLRCIAGLEHCVGEIHLESKVLSDKEKFTKPEKRGFGMVFQNYAVWPHMDVFENVAFPLRIQKFSTDQIKKRVDAILELTHLDNFAKRFPHQLSGGQQQRVAIARALVVEPKILLLDEPLSNLDAQLRGELGTEIQRLQKQLHITTILVTHDQREALSLSDKLFILDNGKIEASGTTEDLFLKPPNDFVAEFLTGSSRLQNQNGNGLVVNPRKWKITNEKSHNSLEVKIEQRLFFGFEYEYHGLSSIYKTPIKFFSDNKLAIGDSVLLEQKNLFEN